ncbi:MAG: hypothetical protein B7733_13755 [Myxococcales bacterium FL481]|nr:MAG: hypothetical protein B7733_13755 [Myxococcales bacterium FL481]
MEPAAASLKLPDVNMNLRTRTLGILFLLPLAGAGCSEARVRADTSAPAYAGEADIRYSRDKTGNGTIKLTIDHLAAPERIGSNYTAYVAWLEVEGREPAKLGVLEYDPKKRRGELTVSAAHKKLRLLVTLEESRDVVAPAGVRILAESVTAKR